MAKSELKLNGQIIVVTGASKGIGAGISKDLSKEGATTILCARNLEKLNELKHQIEKGGGIAYVFQLDISSVSEITSVFGKIYDQFGRIDVLINNAGLGNNHAAIDVRESDWDDMMDINLKGLFFCSQQAGKYMMRKAYGRIINMSSQASIVAIKDHAVYCASKGGVNQLTKVLALEWAEKGITVNGISPTFTYTPGTAERLNNPEYLANVINRIPVGKVASIHDISAAIMYLIGPNSSMVTGANLVIDGGVDHSITSMVNKAREKVFKGNIPLISYRGHPFHSFRHESLSFFLRHQPTGTMKRILCFWTFCLIFNFNHGQDLGEAYILEWKKFYPSKAQRSGMHDANISI